MTLPHLLNIAPCGYFRVSEDHHVIEINHTLLGWLGYTHEEVVGAPLSLILTSASRLYYLTHLLPALQMTGLISEQRLQLYSNEGNQFSVILNAQRNDQEEISCYDCAVLPSQWQDAIEPEAYRLERPRNLASGDPIGGSFPATLMRGGSSKGLFVRGDRMPDDPADRDRLLTRAMGSPDPYGSQMDGLGCGSSSTSKVVIVDTEDVPKGCQLAFTFGAVAIDRQFIDWSGNCGNLTSAVVPFAIDAGLITPPWTPERTLFKVLLWQRNLGRVIEAAVPVRFGQLDEDGNYEVDGVAFPAAEVPLTFMKPAGPQGVLPTGRPLQPLAVPGLGEVDATLVDAGNPTVFVHPKSLGIAGTEPRHELSENSEFLLRCEAIRASATVAMGLADSPEQASRERPHAPKLAWVLPPTEFRTSNGRRLRSDDMDVLVRMVSMGQVHHAITGTGSVATAAAAAIPDTLVATQLLQPLHHDLRVAHTAGVVTVSAWGREKNGQWHLNAVSLSRSARVLMRGTVRVPALTTSAYQPLKH